MLLPVQYKRTMTMTKTDDWLQECQKLRDKIYGTNGLGPAVLCLCCMVHPYKNCGICGRGICEECYWGPCARVNQYIGASDDHRCIDNPLTVENHPQSFPTPSTHKCKVCGATTHTLYKGHVVTSCSTPEPHRWLQQYPGDDR